MKYFSEKCREVDSVLSSYLIHIFNPSLLKKDCPIFHRIEYQGYFYLHYHLWSEGYSADIFFNKDIEESIVLYSNLEEVDTEPPCHIGNEEKIPDSESLEQTLKKVDLFLVSIYRYLTKEDLNISLLKFR